MLSHKSAHGIALAELEISLEVVTDARRALLRPVSIRDFVRTDVKEGNGGRVDLVRQLLVYARIIRDLDNLNDMGVGIDIDKTDGVIALPSHEARLSHNKLWSPNDSSKESAWNFEMDFAGQRISDQESLISWVDIQVLRQIW